MRSEIIQLVLSLTPSERREFKIKNVTSSDFVTVLDYIHKTKSLDYSELRTYFEKKFPERSTNYTSGYFSSVVSYMQEKIFEIIVESEKNRAYVEINRRLARYYALSNRSLHKMAWQELEICKKIAIKNHLYEEQLLINRQEYIIHNFSRYENISKEELAVLKENSDEIIRELELQHQYIDLLSQISLNYYRESFDVAVFQKIFDLGKEDLVSKNFWTLNTHKFNIANNLLFTGNYTAGFEQYEEIIAMWKEERNLMQLLPRMFLIQVQSYFNWLLKIPGTNESNVQKEKANMLLKLLEAEIQGFTYKLDIQFCNEIILIIQFWLLKENKMYHEITQNVQEEEISQYTDQHNRMHLIYSIAYSYFQLNMSDKSLQLIEPFVEGNYDYKSNNYIFIKMLMLRILIYKEKKDEKYVLYLIQNAKYLFKKYSFDSDYEKFFLALMQRMSGKTYTKNASTILNNAKIELTKIVELKKDYLMLSDWIEKKILA